MQPIIDNIFGDSTPTGKSTAPVSSSKVSLDNIFATTPVSAPATKTPVTVQSAVDSVKAPKVTTVEKTPLIKDNSTLGIIKNTITGIPNALTGGLLDYLKTPEGENAAANLSWGDVGRSIFPAIANIPGQVISDITGKDINLKSNFPNIAGDLNIKSIQNTTKEAVQNGENPFVAVLKAVPQAIFDGLMIAGVAQKVFSPRLEVIATGYKPVEGEVTNIETGLKEQAPIPVKDKSFRLTSILGPESKQNIIPNEAIDKLAKEQGVKINYDPKQPSFFKQTIGINGKIKGEIIQLKPSYFDKFKSMFNGEINSVPKEGITTIYEKTTTIDKLQAKSETSVIQDKPLVPSKENLTELANNISEGKPIETGPTIKPQKTDIESLASQFKPAPAPVEKPELFTEKIPATSEGKIIAIGRHGSTDSNGDKAFRGWEETSKNQLSVKGKEDAKSLGASIKKNIGTENPKDFVIVSSDLNRAKDSAKIASEISGVPVGKAYPQLRSQDTGEFSGVKESEVKKQVTDINNNRPNEPLPGATESHNQFITRAKEALKPGGLIEKENPGKKIIVVTHHQVEVMHNNDFSKTTDAMFDKGIKPGGLRTVEETKQIEESTDKKSISSIFDNRLPASPEIVRKAILDRIGKYGYTEKDLHILFTEDELDGNADGSFQKKTVAYGDLVKLFEKGGKANIVTGFHESGHFLFSMMPETLRTEMLEKGKEDIGPIKMAQLERDYKSEGVYAGAGRKDALIEEYVVEKWAKTDAKDYGYEPNWIQKVFGWLDDLMKKIIDLFKGIEKSETTKDIEIKDNGEVTPFFNEKNNQSKSLIAVHNISQGKLTFAHKIGSLINPSVAVIDIEKQGFDNYGEISLIGNKNLLEQGKTFASDIYSPRFPSLTIKIPKQGYDILNSTFKKYEDVVDEKLYSLDMEDFNRTMENSSLAMYDFLNKKGIEVPKTLENGASHYEIKNGMRELIHDNNLEEKFADYISKLKDEIGATEHIFKGYTYSGNRRYVPATVENISKDMKTRGLANKEGMDYGLGSFRAQLVTRLSSIKKIKEAQGRIVTSEEFEKTKKEMDTKYSDLIFEYAQNLKPGVGSKNPFINFDEVSQGLSDYITGKFPEFLDRFSEVSQSLKDKTQEFIKEVKSMPTEYFESKFTRPVKMSEFSYAIVPDSMSEEGISKLESEGLKVITYQKGNEADRLLKIKEIQNKPNADEIFFNKKNGRVELPEIPYQEKRVTDYLTRLKIRGVDPILVNAIITPSKNRAYGAYSGGTLSFEKVIQQFTEDHEVFHLIFENFDKMRIFDGFYKKGLLNEAKTLYGKDLSNTELEENFASDYQQYVHDRENNRQSTFFGKIKEFFERLYSAFKRIFRTPRDIKEFYRMIYEGKAKEDTTITNKMPASFNKQAERGVIDFSKKEWGKFNLEPEKAVPISEILDKKFPKFETGNKLEDAKAVLNHIENKLGVSSAIKSIKDQEAIMEIAKETLDMSPMKELEPYVADAGAYKGTLPEVTGKTPEEIKKNKDFRGVKNPKAIQFAQKGDSIAQEITSEYGLEMDSNDVRAEFEDYKTQKEKLAKQEKEIKKQKLEFGNKDTFELIGKDKSLVGEITATKETPETIKEIMNQVMKEKKARREEVLNHPARPLMKYVNKKDNKLPKIGSDTAFGKEGIQILQDLHFNDVKEANNALQDYISKRNEFVNPTSRLALDERNARFLRDKQKIMEEVEKKIRAEGKDRKAIIEDIRDYFYITEGEMKDIIGSTDYRLISDKEFNDLTEKIREESLKIAEHTVAISEVEWTIAQKELHRVENLQQVMKFPVDLNKMTTEQLDALNSELGKFEKGDVFLGVREIETLGKNAGLPDVKTQRQILEEVIGKRTNVPIEEIKAITTKSFDEFRGAVSLARQNPFYNILVSDAYQLKIEAGIRYQEVENKINELIKKARDSRKKSLVQRLAPTDDMVIYYLEEGDMETKEMLAKKMSKAELELAHYVQSKYAEMRDFLVSREQLERIRENYYTHRPRGFLEAWLRDGQKKSLKQFVGAFASAFKETIIDIHKMDEATFKILDERTEDVLPLEKFFKYSMRRSGQLIPTRNLAKAFLGYVKTFEIKKGLDQYIPRMEAVARALTPTEQTEGGLIKDTSLERFVKKWINTQKGRPISLGPIHPGDTLDSLLRTGVAFTRFLDLALRVPAQVMSLVGEESATFINIGAKQYALGQIRAKTKQGKAIAEKYESFVGRTFWEKMKEQSTSIESKLGETLFAFYGIAARNANIHHLLGVLTLEEFKTGNISPERLTEIKKEINRWRADDILASVMGKTSVGGVFREHKSWAIPILNQTLSDMKTLTNMIKTGEFKTAAKSKEFGELFRATMLTLFLVLTATKIYQDLINKGKSRNLAEELLYRGINDAFSFLSALSPTTLFTTPRLMTFISDLSKNVALISQALATGTKTAKGEIAGLKPLIQQFTPKLFSSLLTPSQDDKIMTSITTSTIAAQKKLDAIDIKIIDPAEKAWDEVKKVGSGTEEADAIVENLSDDEYTAYKEVKASDTDYWVELTKKVTPLVEQAYKLEFGSPEADKLIEGLTDDEYKAYQTVKKNLYGTGESTASPSDWDKQSFLTHVTNLAKGWSTDPATAFDNLIHGDWKITKIKGGAIIVNRMPMDASQAIKTKAAKNNANYKLDHVIPLEISGTNRTSNLNIITTEQWQENTPVENYLGKALGKNEITNKEARELIIRYKVGAGQTLSDELMKEYQNKYGGHPITFDEIKQEVVQ